MQENTLSCSSMGITKLVFMVAAQASFLAADILFLRSAFAEHHPLIAYWVLHLPFHYLNSLFLFKLYGDEVDVYQWQGQGVPVLGLHLKALFQISTNFSMLSLMGIFKQPLSGDVPDGLDVCLLGSTALLIVYALIVSSYLPNFDLGVSLTGSLTGLYMTILYNISGIGFQLKGVALVVLLSLIVIKIYVEYAIQPDKPHQEHQV